MKIKNPVNLKFDPSTCDKNIQEIFLDDLTRTLWMGIKQRHLANQYFDKHCIKAAEKIKDYGSLSAPELKKLLEKEFRFNFDAEFVEDLLPYVTGDKKLEYTIKYR